MKRLIAIATLVIVIVATAAAESMLYRKCENVKGLTTVYITRQMLRMAATMGPTDEGAMSMLRDKIDNVMIVTAQDAKGVRHLDGLRDELTPRNGYEQLMRINDDNENVVIVQKPCKDDRSEYAISVIGKDHATMIVVEGTLTLEDLARLQKGLDGNPPIRKK